MIRQVRGQTFWNGKPQDQAVMGENHELRRLLAQQTTEITDLRQRVADLEALCFGTAASTQGR